MQDISTQKVRAFRSQVYSFYRNHRRDLPWRRTTDPYHILVSEIMLQQTQVDRTVLKYNAFIRSFPTLQKLAHANTREVLAAWQGMGYNRRALNLKKCAQDIVRTHSGKVPSNFDSLIQLPGIGPYTARAILAFAFNAPVVLIETNVRSVYLHHFFPNKKNISDSSILPLIERTLDAKHPREWYSALMDYGSFLKKIHPNPSRRSAHHVKQSRFQGSVRQARGAVLKELLKSDSLSLTKLHIILGLEPTQIDAALKSLMREGIIERRGAKIRLATQGA